jgi:hypothetical protein
MIPAAAARSTACFGFARKIAAGATVRGEG